MADGSPGALSGGIAAARPGALPTCIPTPVTGQLAELTLLITRHAEPLARSRCCFVSYTTNKVQGTHSERKTDRQPNCPLDITHLLRQPPGGADIAVHSRVLAHTHVGAHIHAHIHTYIHTNLHTYKYTHTQTHTCTHIHAHTHTHTPNSASSKQGCTQDFCVRGLFCIRGFILTEK